MKPSVLFLDVGGVLLTNGWDTAARNRAVAHFDLAGDEFRSRHSAVYDAFETGRLDLDGYLDQVVFHHPRPFSREEFWRFMRDQSSPHPAAIALARRLARLPGLTMATINNESLPLNRYRIETFGLKPLFTAFFSSCYLGVRKPDPGIFRLAVRVMQERPEACLFVDDRSENVEAAREIGVRALHYQGVDRLRAELTARGIGVPDG